MLFVIECRDKAGALDVRMATRPDHLAFLEGLGDRLVLAGPFLDENEKPCGSLVVVKVDDKTAAEAIASDDPYAHAGLFDEVTIRPWVWAINKPEGL